KFNAQPHAVFRNNGDGTFTDVSLDAGLRMPRTSQQYAAFEARIREYFKTESSGVPSQKHEDKIAQWMKRLRTAQEQREYGKGLGVIAADVNGDGKPDIYVANDTVDNFLYMNRSRPGHIRLEEKGLAAGVARDDKGVTNGSMGTDAADPLHKGRPALWCTKTTRANHALA